jgi:serine/tyrosine/threonine adenylyltransferase
MKPLIAFDNSYSRLPSQFAARVLPAVAEAPALIRVNRTLADELGIDPDWLESPEGLEVLSGQRIAPGSDPIATAYAGHQFGNFVPQLGDGRAILLGEVIDRAGRRRDVQLKGAGRTPFSRGGDGRAALGPVLREYVVSEAMAALGIPTTRALAAVTTGEPVIRERALPGAVLTRVASSHIRVGTFQFFAARNDHAALRVLADYVIDRHYPSAREAENPYVALLDAVVQAQAKLIAGWMLVGFIHGVMNTDNMSVAGETIDYGPCAFLDEYHPATVFSSIDRQGRYAYGNQPRIGQWDLARLAETLLPVIAEDPEAAIAPATAVLETFGDRFRLAFEQGMARKLGLAQWREDDTVLANTMFEAMAQNQVDFTLFFRRLAAAHVAGEADEPVRSLFVNPQDCDIFLEQWRARLEADPLSPPERRQLMDSANPAFIPRNHRIEAMIAAAVDSGDFEPFEELLRVLSRPFEDQPEFAGYADPPAADERVTATFCGT